MARESTPPKLRKTTLRTALLELLNESESPLSVPEILEHLKKRSLTPNKTTLYREADTLLKHAILEETVISGVRKLYITQHGHHHHFICLTCKTTSCIEDPSLEDALLKVQDTLITVNGFLTSGHDLNFYGQCRECR
jgi:Fe2+ or Zn2+ uptake regulation protein